MILLTSPLASSKSKKRTSTPPPTVTTTKTTSPSSPTRHLTSSSVVLEKDELVVVEEEDDDDDDEVSSGSHTTGNAVVARALVDETSPSISSSSSSFSSAQLDNKGVDVDIDSDVVDVSSKAGRRRGINDKDRLMLTDDCRCCDVKDGHHDYSISSSPIPPSIKPVMIENTTGTAAVAVPVSTTTGATEAGTVDSRTAATIISQSSTPPLSASIPINDISTSSESPTPTKPCSAAPILRRENGQQTQQETRKVELRCGGRPRTERRVRGIWSMGNVVFIPDTDTSRQLKEQSVEDESFTHNHHQQQFTTKNENDRHRPFEKLRDETLINILSFLDLADLSRSSQTSRRWSCQVRSEQSLWKRVDASSFCQCAYRNFTGQRRRQLHAMQQDGDIDTGKRNDTKLLNSPSVLHQWAQRKTGQALETILQDRKPESLIITGINDVLSADNFHLPSQLLSSLQELTVSHFNTLSDTHLHVLLLMTLGGETGSSADALMRHKRKSKRPPHNSLRSLALEHCKLLTNASLTSIALICGDIVSLSLRGNASISIISPLQDLFVTKVREEHQHGDPASPLTHSFRSQTEEDSSEVFCQETKNSLVSYTQSPTLPHSVASQQQRNNANDTEKNSWTSFVSSGSKRQITNSEQAKERAAIASLLAHHPASSDHHRHHQSHGQRDGTSSVPTTMLSLFSSQPAELSTKSPSNSSLSLSTPHSTPKLTPANHKREHFYGITTEVGNTVSQPVYGSLPSTSLTSSSSVLTNLFDFPGASPSRKIKTTIDLSSSSPSLPGWRLSSTGPTVGMRRYRHHQLSLSNTAVLFGSASVHEPTVVGRLNQLNLTETSIPPQAVIRCFLEIISLSQLSASKALDFDASVPSDLWGFICLNTLCMSPPSSHLDSNTSQTPHTSLFWTHQDCRLLERILRMQELEELHLMVRDETGLVTRLV